MIKGNKLICLLAMALILTALSTTLIVSAQTNLASTFGEWHPQEDFVDPVTQQIEELKAQGLNEEQITVKLSELGMGWYPKTGATWLGRTLAPE